MKKLIIQLWQTNFKSIELAATPFLMATTAAAMDMDVEIHATGASVEMFVKDNERRHQLVMPSGRRLSDFIEDAMRTGVRVHACSTAMRDRGLDLKNLIDGFGEVIGMVTMLDRATAEDTTVMTF